MDKRSNSNSICCKSTVSRKAQHPWIEEFFFQTLNWHWHEPSKTLWPGIHLSFYASSGEPIVTAASLQKDVDNLSEQGSSTQIEELHWEEMYYKRRLLFAAIDVILNQVSPKVQQWLDESPKPRRTVEGFSIGQASNSSELTIFARNSIVFIEARIWTSAIVWRGN